MVTPAPASAWAPARALAPAPAGPGISFACGNPRHEHRTASMARCCTNAIAITERSAVWHPCASCGVVLIHRDEVVCSECDEGCVDAGAIIVRQPRPGPGGVVVCGRRAPP